MWLTGLKAPTNYFFFFFDGGGRAYTSIKMSPSSETTVVETVLLHFRGNEPFLWNHFPGNFPVGTTLLETVLLHFHENEPPLLKTRPRGLTFTWWGCHGLCLRHKLTELAHSFLFCSCVCFCLYGPFNFISFLEFSRQLSVFSLCSSGLISALLVLSTICLFMKVSFSPDIIHSGCLGSKHQLTN